MKNFFIGITLLTGAAALAQSPMVLYPGDFAKVGETKVQCMARVEPDDFLSLSDDLLVIKATLSKVGKCNLVKVLFNENVVVYKYKVLIEDKVATYVPTAWASLEEAGKAGAEKLREFIKAGFCN